VTSEKIAYKAKEHTGQVKLLTGILFIALGVLLSLFH